MKSITGTIVAAIAALITFGTTTEETRAADLRLEGRGVYKLGTYVKYFPKGATQSGRYGNLGADYYHKSKIGVDWINNRSPKSSNSMSFEFWAMPYYGATRGIILMTRGVKPLRAGGAISDAHADGYAIFADTYRYPEINLWEKSGSGWKFRDALTFSKKDVL